MCPTPGETPTETIPTLGITGLFSRGGWQTKKVAYALMILASTVWLSVDLRRGITTEWIAVYTIFASAATTGYIWGKKISQAQP